jgi:hypothetical protein
MRYLAFFLLFSLVGFSQSESPASIDPNVLLLVSVASDRSEFHIGETIPLSLAFSSAIKDRYQINMAQYDRSGRMNYEQFNLSPSESIVDPLEGHLGGVGGGLTGFKFLTPEPWTITLNLNEWVRFTHPGDYCLTVTSNRVGIKDSSSPLGATPITARSNEITLRIIPATKAWQKTVLSGAVATLDQPAAVPGLGEIYEVAATSSGKPSVFGNVGGSQGVSKTVAGGRLGRTRLRMYAGTNLVA